MANGVWRSVGSFLVESTIKFVLDVVNELALSGSLLSLEFSNAVLYRP